MTRGPPSSPLFPYTTLFRSQAHAQPRPGPLVVIQFGLRAVLRHHEIDTAVPIVVREGRAPLIAVRSEEHTSELQSRRDLVCRLLLEKKKTRVYQHDP